MFVTPLRRFALASLLLAWIPACIGSGNLSAGAAATAGTFAVSGVNILDGSIWELNRPIRIEFNHPVDPQSVNFSSILISANDTSLGGRPVTGSFTLDPNEEGRVVIFYPTCPVADTLDDGAFLPGGFLYQLELPTKDSFAASLVRDTAGNQLEIGIAVSFRTPTSPAQPIFIDTNPAPATITTIDWPSRLNFYSDREPLVGLEFDQSVDGRSSNLRLDRLYIEYSDDTATNYAGATPVFSGLLPGSLVLANNCTETGATLNFQVSGILPPDRFLRVVQESSFLDIAGQSSPSRWISASHLTPSLEAVYGAATFGVWNEGDETVDEFHDSFADSSWIDPNASLIFPPADLLAGSIQAAFNYPGQFVPAEQDFYWNGAAGELRTDGQVVFTDSTSRVFTVYNGVLYVDDFYLEEDAVLRCRGTNPLVIYAQGTVEIYGELNAGGNDSHWPTSLNSPQFPEGPILGECGGGLGGQSSAQGSSETIRGDSGDGPFGFAGIGGGGGEGGVQQKQNQGSSASQTARLMAGGGGGGTFAMTSNEAIWWSQWRSSERPASAENNGPDHDPSYSSRYPDGIDRDINTWDFITEPLPVFGGENGMRGSSYEADRYGSDPSGVSPLPQGVFGMEDEKVDVVSPKDPHANSTQVKDFNPRWDASVGSEDPSTWPFDWGHPTDGPDPGLAGRSVFSTDGDTSNDFYGTRLNDDGSVTIGELLLPWAGSGGGASGDSQSISRLQDPGPNQYFPLMDSFPARPFPPSGGYYRKGAPGGGGGGQLQILAVGPIILGDETLVRSDGGIGHGGESTIYTYGQISGSGGGSGGHVILHSATELDLSSIYIGTASNAGEVPNLQETIIMRAKGGRRGWAGSWNSRIPESSNKYDGNGDLMVGRGGAGGNGVIQVHVPDPAKDILWNASAKPGIDAYVANFGVGVTTNVEAILSLFSKPRPYVLLPFFSSQSQVQSVWIDTGLAHLHLDPALTGDFPRYGEQVGQSLPLKFEGFDLSTGEVTNSAGQVTALPGLLTADYSTALLTANALTLPGASTFFGGLEHFLRHPAALEGYAVLPDSTKTSAIYLVVSADYEAATDTLTMNTDAQDGSMLANFGATWVLQPRFFSITTTANRDSMPTNTAVVFEFQGTSDVDDPGATLPSTVGWTSDLSILNGQRWIRYRVSFDIDAQGAGVSQNNPKPSLEYLKLPFVW